jgi:hypothetical protein
MPVRRARVLGDEPASDASGLAAAFGINFQLGRGLARRPSGRALVLPLKNLALSLLEVRARVSGLSLSRDARRAGRFYVQAILDRHAQYNGARLEKASEELTRVVTPGRGDSFSFLS